MAARRAARSHASSLPSTGEDESDINSNVRNSRPRRWLRLGCIAIDAVSMAVGLYRLLFSVGDWWTATRLCAGSVGGATLLRGRRRRKGVSKVAIAFHALLILEFARKAAESGLDDVREVADDDIRRQIPEPLVGRELGYDDSLEVGWVPDLEDLSWSEIRRRHARLVQDAEQARRHRDARATKTFCWKSVDFFKCIPEIYLLGMPKCGSSELWESLVRHPKVVKARHKETRFFTRGEFGGNRRGPDSETLTADTTLDSFAKEHAEASYHISEAILKENSISDAVLVDGGPHTLWWSTQAYDGSDTGMAPIPQLLRTLVPHAKLIVTLAEPGRRSYSDYWFLTEQGVARRGRSSEQEQSADDFHDKMVVDTHAMELCFDRFSTQATSSSRRRHSWPLSAVQRCAYDRFHFGRNGRGRIAAGLYVAFIARWLDAFDRSQLLVVRLEDRWTQDDSVYKFIGIDAPPKENEQPHVVNAARNSRPPMRPDTSRLLRKFYAPHNRRLATLLGDDKFLWDDALPNEWANVTGRQEPPKQHQQQQQHLSPPSRASKKNRKPSSVERLLDKRTGKLKKPVATSIVNFAGLGQVNELVIELQKNPKRSREELSEALVLATLRLDVDIVEILVKHGADPSAELASSMDRARGMNALHVACLASFWADSMRGSFVFTALEGRAESPLKTAIEYGDTDVGRSLVSGVRRTTIGGAEIREALDRAVTGVARVLTAHGANATATDKDGRTPAHFCAQSGFADGLDVVLRAANGSTVDATENIHGATPSHLAAVWGQASTLRLLVVDHEANPNVVDKHGNSVRDVASGPGAPISAFVAEDDELRAALGNVEKAKPTRVEKFVVEDTGGWRPANESVRDMLMSSVDEELCDFAVVDARIDGDTLFDKYISQNKPVLVRGMLDTPEWDGARRAYARRQLIEAHGASTVKVSAIPYAKKFSSSFGERAETLAAYVSAMLNHSLSEGGSDAHPWYVFKGHPVAKMPKEFELDWFVERENVQPPPSIFDAFVKADNFSGVPLKGLKSGEFWPFVNVQWALGSAGSGAPMHFHNTAWNACIYGSKRWIAYPPAYNVMSNEQIRYWDENVRHRTEVPQGRQPKPFTCVQRQGDVAIIPELWGHGVLNLQDTVAVAVEVKSSMYRAPLPREFKKLQAIFRRRLEERNLDFDEKSYASV